MFDIGWQELIVLGAVALVVFPPKEFPNLLKTMIGITNKIRATTQELQHHIHNFSKTHLEDISSDISTETAKARNLIHDSSRRIQKQIDDLENRAKAAAKNPNPKKSSKKPSKKSSQTPALPPPAPKAKATSSKAKTTSPKAKATSSKAKATSSKAKTTSPKAPTKAVGKAVAKSVPSSSKPSSSAT